MSRGELGVKEQGIFHTILICSSTGSFGKEVKDVAGAFSLENDMFSIVIIVKLKYNPHKHIYLSTENKGGLSFEKEAG